MKKWQIRLRDYLIQLSVVVLGIFITFGISDFIKAKQERKEFKASLALLKIELLSNLKEVQSIREGLEHLDAGARHLYEVQWDFPKLPSDTLKKYINIPVYIQWFSYNQYALDMVKSRSTSASFQDRQMLSDLLDCYRGLQSFKGWTDYYVDKLKDVMEDLDVGILHKHMKDNNVVACWEYMMQNPKIKNYVMDYVNIGERVRRATNTEENVREVLEKLEKEL